MKKDNKFLLDFVTQIVNDQTDPLSIIVKLNGDIEIVTNDGGVNDNLEIAEILIEQLEIERFAYEIWCANATNGR